MPKYSVVFNFMFTDTTGHGKGPIKVTVYGDSMNEIENNLRDLIIEGRSTTNNIYDKYYPVEDFAAKVLLETK